MSVPVVGPFAVVTIDLSPAAVVDGREQIVYYFCSMESKSDVRMLWVTPQQFEEGYMTFENFDPSTIKHHQYKMVRTESYAGRVTAVLVEAPDPDPTP
jgi:hypothetical protein